MEDFEELKKLISSILISSPLQMTVQKLNRDFADQVGFNIPFSKFGFRSLEQCLHAMRDVLEVRGTGMQAEIIVHVSSKSAHIDKLIAHQKTKPPKKHYFGNRPKVHSRRSRAIPIVHNQNSFNVVSNVQNIKPVLPERVTRSSTSQPYYIPPALRTSEPLKEMLPKGNSRQNLSSPKNQFDLQPLMSKIVMPPKSSPSPENYSRHLSPRSELTNYNKLEMPSCIGKAALNEHTAPVFKEDIFKLDNTNLALPHGNFDYDSKVDNSLGAVPREIGSSSNSKLQEVQNQEDGDIYSSDEEEIVNMQVPLKVQQNLQVLIDKYADGIWCAKLPQAYKKLFNKEIDYAEYGYRSLIHMCMDLKTIFFWYQPDNGDFKLYDRTKPPPKDLDKHFKQSDYFKTCSYLNSQPSNEPALADIEEYINTELEDCYPPDIVQLMDEIPRQFIPENPEDEYIDVCVGEVYDPSKFWLMLREYSPLLDELMDEMQTFYMNCPELKIPPHMIKIGLYCAAVYNNEYHRAIIVNLMPQQKDKVKVFYVDYGTVSSTLVANLHFLHKSFFNLPQQAIRARLARIYPPTTNTLWSIEASSRFLDLIRMKNLVAHLDRVDYNQQIVEVFLVDTSGEEDIYMNDALVEEGYAIFTHEEQKEILLDPHFIPKVKYLHLIPTFDDMEQGIVPNASEMIRLQKVGVSIEQILSQYFTQVKAVDISTSDSSTIPSVEQKNRKKSSVAVRRSQLKILSDNKPIIDKDSSLLEKGSTTSLKSYSDIAEFIDERDSPSPEVLVVKPTVVRPPPGFESIQAQKIEITATSQKVDGGKVVNAVVTQTTNIEASDSQNILSYLFNNANGITNTQPVSAPTSIVSQPMSVSYATQNMMDQLMLLKTQQNLNNMQQAHLLGYSQPNQNFYPTQQMLNSAFPNHNLYNTQFINQNMHNMHPTGMPINPPSHYNQVLSPLRVYMQESIIELLLMETKPIVNRFMYIIKKRLSRPGVHQVIFNLISDIINKLVIYPRDKLVSVYKEALCFLSDEDIADLANEAKPYTSAAYSNCATTQTQSVPLTDTDNIKDKLEQLNIKGSNRPENKTGNIGSESLSNKQNAKPSINQNLESDEQRIPEKLIVQIDFQNNRLHIICLQNEAFVMVNEILQIVDKKMPIELVRKCIVMTDPSISVLDIRLQEHKALAEELSKYMYIDSAYTLHVVPLVFVPKLINAIGNRKDLASNFQDFLTRVQLNRSMSLLS